MSNNGREYKSMKVFVEGDDGKKRPVEIGYAYEDNGKIRFQITALPPPGAKTNWSGTIESRDDRGSRLSGSADRRAPSASRPAWGTSGHGNSAKHTTTPDGGGDDFGGYSDADGDDGIPFISQSDTVRKWLR